MATYMFDLHNALYTAAYQFQLDPTHISYFHRYISVLHQNPESKYKIQTLAHMVQTSNSVILPYLVRFLPGTKPTDCTYEARFQYKQANPNAPIDPLDYATLAWTMLSYICYAAIDSDSAVRLQAFRTARYFVTNDVTVESLLALGFDYILSRSLQRDNKYINERIQAMKFIRASFQICSVFCTRPIVQALIALAEHTKDEFRLISLDTLRELLVSHPYAINTTHGLTVILDSLLDSQLNEISSSLSWSLLYLYDIPSTRHLISPTLEYGRFFSAYTDLTGVAFSSSSATTIQTIHREREQRRATSHIVLLTFLRSLSGIFALGSNVTLLTSFIRLLSFPSRLPGVSWSKEATFELLYDVIRLVSSYDYLTYQRLRLLTLKRINNNNDTNLKTSSSLTNYGHFGGSGNTNDNFNNNNIITNHNIQHINLLHNYMTLVLSACIRCGLLEHLAILALSNSETLSIPALKLLTEVTRLILALFPSNIATQLSTYSVIFQNASVIGRTHTLDTNNNVIISSLPFPSDPSLPSLAFNPQLPYSTPQYLASLALPAVGSIGAEGFGPDNVAWSLSSFEQCAVASIRVQSLRLLTHLFEAGTTFLNHVADGPDVAATYLHDSAIDSSYTSLTNDGGVVQIGQHTDGICKSSFFDHGFELSLLASDSDSSSSRHSYLNQQQSNTAIAGFGPAHNTVTTPSTGTTTTTTSTTTSSSTNTTSSVPPIVVSLGSTVPMLALSNLPTKSNTTTTTGTTNSKAVGGLSSINSSSNTTSAASLLSKPNVILPPSSQQINPFAPPLHLCRPQKRSGDLFNLYLQSQTSQSDAAVLKLIKNTNILNTKDQFQWNFTLALHILETCTLSRAHFLSALRSKFFKRLLSFLRPDKRMFSDMYLTIPHATLHAKVAAQVIRVLVMYPEGREYAFFGELLELIIDCLAEEAHRADMLLQQQQTLMEQHPANALLCQFAQSVTTLATADEVNLGPSSGLSMGQALYKGQLAVDQSTIVELGLIDGELGSPAYQFHRGHFAQVTLGDTAPSQTNNTLYDSNEVSTTQTPISSSNQESSNAVSSKVTSLWRRFGGTTSSNTSIPSTQHSTSGLDNETSRRLQNNNNNNNGGQIGSTLRQTTTTMNESRTIGQSSAFDTSNDVIANSLHTTNLLDECIYDNDGRILIKVRPFSQHALSHRLSREYITFFGILSSTTFGFTLLLKYGFFDLIVPFGSCPEYDYLSRLILLRIDFTNLSSTSICHHLRSLLENWVLNGSTYLRRTIVTILRTLSRQNITHFRTLGLHLTIAMLYCPDPQVSLNALSLLEEVCSLDQLCLDTLIHRNPDLLRFGTFANNLLYGYLTTPHGFNILLQNGWLFEQLKLWSMYGGASHYTHTGEIVMSSSLSNHLEFDSEEATVAALGTSGPTSSTGNSTNNGDVTTSVLAHSIHNSPYIQGRTMLALPNVLTKNAMWSPYIFHYTQSWASRRAVHLEHDEYFRQRMLNLPWDAEIILDCPVVTTAKNNLTGQQPTQQHRKEQIAVSTFVMEGFADAGTPLVVDLVNKNPAWAAHYGLDQLASKESLDRHTKQQQQQKQQSPRESSNTQHASASTLLADNEIEGSHAMWVVALCVDSNGAPKPVEIDIDAVLHARVSPFVLNGEQSIGRCGLAQYSPTTPPCVNALRQVNGSIGPSPALSSGNTSGANPTTQQTINPYAPPGSPNGPPSMASHSGIPGTPAWIPAHNSHLRNNPYSHFVHAQLTNQVTSYYADPNVFDDETTTTKNNSILPVTLPTHSCFPADRQSFLIPSTYNVDDMLEIYSPLRSSQHSQHCNQMTLFSIDDSSLTTATATFSKPTTHRRTISNAAQAQVDKNNQNEDNLRTTTTLPSTLSSVSFASSLPDLLSVQPRALTTEDFLYPYEASSLTSAFGDSYEQCATMGRLDPNKMDTTALFPRAELISPLSTACPPADRIHLDAITAQRIPISRGVKMGFSPQGSTAASAAASAAAALAASSANNNVLPEEDDLHFDDESSSESPPPCPSDDDDEDGPPPPPPPVSPRGNGGTGNAPLDRQPEAPQPSNKPNTKQNNSAFFTPHLLDFSTCSYYILSGNTRWNFIRPQNQPHKLLLTSVWFKITPSHDIMPSVNMCPHLYGQVAQTLPGCGLLYRSGILHDAAMDLCGVHPYSMASSAHKSSSASGSGNGPNGTSLTSTGLNNGTPTPPFSLVSLQARRCAAWNIAHIGTSELGIRLLIRHGLVSYIAQQTFDSPILSFRGTCFILMGLFSLTAIGRDHLDMLGWDCTSDESQLCTIGTALPRDISRFFHVQESPLSTNFPLQPAYVRPVRPTSQSERAPVSYLHLSHTSSSSAGQLSPQEQQEREDRIIYTQVVNGLVHLPPTSTSTAQSAVAGPGGGGGAAAGGAAGGPGFAPQNGGGANGSSNSGPSAQDAIIQCLTECENIHHGLPNTRALEIILGHISNLSNNVTQRPSLVILRTWATQFPKLFRSPVLYAKVLQLIDWHTFALPARRFIIFDLFNHVYRTNPALDFEIIRSITTQHEKPKESLMQSLEQQQQSQQQSTQQTTGR